MTVLGEEERFLHRHHLQTAVGMGLDAPILLSVLFSNGFGEGWMSGRGSCPTLVRS